MSSVFLPFYLLGMCSLLRAREHNEKGHAKTVNISLCGDYRVFCIYTQFRVYEGNNGVKGYALIQYGGKLI